MSPQKRFVDVPTPRTPERGRLEAGPCRCGWLIGTAATWAPNPTGLQPYSTNGRVQAETLERTARDPGGRDWSHTQQQALALRGSPDPPHPHPGSWVKAKTEASLQVSEEAQPSQHVDLGLLTSRTVTTGNQFTFQGLAPCCTNLQRTPPRGSEAFLQLAS